MLFYVSRKHNQFSSPISLVSIPISVENAVFTLTSLKHHGTASVGDDVSHLELFRVLVLHNISE
jgi:hypothetical protein